MKIRQAIALTLLFPSALLLHAKNKKPIVPAVFGQARYVYVQAIDGQEFDLNLNPDDRIAISDVRNALDNWKRYILTTNRSEADVVVVVRKGRAADVVVAVPRGRASGADVGVTPRGGPLPGGAGQPRRRPRRLHAGRAGGRPVPAAVEPV